MVFQEVVLIGSFSTEVEVGITFLSIFGATDASVGYGLGGTIAVMSRADVEDLARQCVSADVRAELDALPASHRAHATPTCCRPGLVLSDFEVIFFLKTASAGHINLDEPRAVIKYIRWTLRYERLVLLVDSRVVLGAIKKGRSSSWSLNFLLRQLPALSFVGGLTLYVGYIPSDHNPGGYPSRGGPASWPAALRQATRQGDGWSCGNAPRTDSMSWKAARYAARRLKPTKAVQRLLALFERQRKVDDVIRKDIGSDS